MNTQEENLKKIPIKIRTFTINEICKICNTTRKQLLYYEEKGLLKDVQRDSGNNYRRYTEKNIQDIIMIKDLRLNGFSLDDILDLFQENSLEGIDRIVRKRMLNAKEDLSRSLMRYQQSTERYIRLLEALSFLKQAQNNKKHGCPSQRLFEVITFPAQHVIAASYDGTFLDEDKMAYRTMGRLHEISIRFNIPTFGTFMACYRGWFDPETFAVNNDRSRTDICLPVDSSAKSCPYYKKLEPVRCVKTTHLGNFDENLVESYRELFYWAKEHHFRLRDYSIEENLISSMLTPNSDFWVTNLMIPIVEED